MKEQIFYKYIDVHPVFINFKFEFSITILLKKFQDFIPFPLLFITGYVLDIE